MSEKAERKGGRDGEAEGSSCTMAVGMMPIGRSEETGCQGSGCWTFRV